MNILALYVARSEMVSCAIAKPSAIPPDFMHACLGAIHHSCEGDTSCENSAMPNAQPSSVPDFLYGTAWKEDRTPALTELAIRSGFRGIDTANQRRHYFEAGVGQGLAAVYRAGLVTRRDLFLQTKFTYQPGQDHRLPYDPSASLSVQVSQSMASSLEHLGT